MSADRFQFPCSLDGDLVAALEWVAGRSAKQVRVSCGLHLWFNLFSDNDMILHVAHDFHIQFRLSSHLCSALLGPDNWPNLETLHGAACKDCGMDRPPYKIIQID